MAVLLQTAARRGTLGPSTNYGQWSSMMKRLFLLFALLGAFAAPASAQMGGRLSVEPYAGYGFFGDLPSGPRLEAAVGYGARLGFQLAPQWAVFANGQRSKPEARGLLSGGGDRGVDQTVDQWSGGIEFSYVPRGGAEGMLPLLLEVGVGQTRYQQSGFLGSNHSDFTVNLGAASALRLSPNFAIRYGANDYISNYRGGEGIVNQVFVRVGAELTF